MSGVRCPADELPWSMSSSVFLEPRFRFLFYIQLGSTYLKSTGTEFIVPTKHHATKNNSNFISLASHTLRREEVSGHAASIELSPRQKLDVTPFLSLQRVWLVRLQLYGMYMLLNHGQVGKWLCPVTT